MDRQTITVDIAPEGYADHRLKVSQYDVGRPLGVYIKQGGTDLDCSGYTAQLYLYKPDRTNIEKLCTIAGNLITWDTAEQETIVAGICVAEIRIREGNRNVGTANFTIWVEESPADTSGSSHSESQSLIDMVDRAEDAAETAESSAAIAVHAKEDAEAAARQTVEAIESYDEMTAAATGLSAGSNPTAEIDRTGDNPVLRLGIPAGNAGYSPTVTITTITGGHRITITDATGDHSADVLDGVDGDDGYSPTVSITTITGGHRITITDKTGDHSVDVMDGEDGDDGYSPTVTVTEITGGHRVVITDQQGQHPFDVMDGEDSAVLSVNGKTGPVVLDGGDINVNNSAQTPVTVADELGNLNRALNDQRVSVDTLYEEKTGDVVIIETPAVIKGVKYILSPVVSETPEKTITGHEGSSFYFSDENSQNATEIDVKFPDSAGIVYGGIINTITKKLVVNTLCVDFSLLRWDIQTFSATNKVFYVTLPSAIPNIKLKWSDDSDYYCISENYDSVGYDKFAGSSKPTYTIAQRNDSGVKRLYVRTTLDATITPSGKAVFECDVPTEYYLEIDPESITPYNGVNKLWAINSDITVQYLRSIITDLSDNAKNISEIKDKVQNFLEPDALPYVDTIPSYYIEPEDTPVSFSGAYSYLDNKIAQIPKDGKSFFLINDVHWGGNQKHSTHLINYIRKRTGIKKVLFGGDVYGYASTKYEAAKLAGSYLYQSRRAFGTDYIPCVGDHDNNTAASGESQDIFLPYEQTRELFVGDLERDKNYHFYNPAEKLAEYVTPGTDDYNGAMDFFHTVYYYDDNINKIRVIALNCGTGSNSYGPMYNVFGASTSDVIRLQLDWLAETLMSTPNGFDVILLAHKGNFNVGAASIVNSIVSNFKRKNPSAYIHPNSSGLPNIDSWWPNEVTYHFGNAPDVGRVIALNGHDHSDMLLACGYIDGVSHNDINGGLTSLTSGDMIVQPKNVMQDANLNTCQIPIILTATDSLLAAEGNPMTPNTVNEQCFDVITLLDDRIVMTRIGAGDDRVIYISDGT